MPINLKSNFKRGDAFLVEDINRTNGAINQLSREIDELKSVINVEKNAVDNKFVENYVNEKLLNFSDNLDKQISTINNSLSDIKNQIGTSKVQFKNILHVDYHCLVFLLLWQCPVFVI